MTATPQVLPAPGLEPRTLADVLVPAGLATRIGSVARDLVIVVVGAVLIALTANFSIPVPGSPVPVTGQTFSVLLVSGALGSRRGIAAVGLYLLMGLFLPVYAEHRSGVGVFGSVQSDGIHFGATGGYLVGFLVASAIVGRLAEIGWDRRLGTAVAAMLVGNVLIYAIGLPWLALAAHLGLQDTLMKGLYPFVLGDALKLMLAGALLPAGWWLVSRRPSERWPSQSSRRGD
jgi:biotin transport system substrate-specific component